LGSETTRIHRARRRAAAWPVEARAQQKVYRIGFLFAGTIALRPPVKEFWKALQELGYVEGNNLIVEIREAHGELTRLPKLASELVDRHPDVKACWTNCLKITLVRFF
jgi:putative ABC transport system substrate-binding protein